MTQKQLLSAPVGNDRKSIQENTMPMISNEQRAKDFFQKLDQDHLDQVDDFYDQNVEFQDPIHQLHGVLAVKKYYKNLYKNVESIRFDFSKSLADGNDVVLVWRMFLKTAALNGGKEFSVDGNSVFTFGGSKGKAIYHRDYFDMGEFIYERVPLLKNLIHFIKRRMSET